MPLFKRREKRGIRASYDPEAMTPAVRRSICTGEMTAGFIDRATGQFRDFMLLRDQRELETFCREVGVGVDEIKTIY